MALTVDLSGRRVLVTGAGQGVGRAIALGCAHAGAEVVVNDLDGDRAEQVVAEVRERGAVGSAAVFDVGDHDAVMHAVGSSGRVDVLVNNAGNAGAEGFGPAACSPRATRPSGSRSCGSTSTVPCTAAVRCCRG